MPYRYEEGMEEVPEAPYVDKEGRGVFRRKPDPKKEKKDQQESSGEKKNGKKDLTKKNQLLAKELGSRQLNHALDRTAMELHNTDKDVNKEERYRLMKEWPAAEKMKKMGALAQRERHKLAEDLCSNKIDKNVVNVNSMLGKLQALEALAGPKSKKRINQEELMAIGKRILPEFDQFDNRYPSDKEKMELVDVIGNCIMKHVAFIVGEKDQYRITDMLCELPLK